MIHAKGTGMETAEKFLGVSLAAEKEIILIVTRKKQKNAIMKAMMEQAGFETADVTRLGGETRHFYFPCRSQAQ